MPLTRRTHTLTQITLFRIALGVSLIVALASGVSYYLFYKQIEHGAQQRLREYSAQRTKFHESYFVLATEYLEVVKKDFLRRYHEPMPDAKQRFNRLMMRYPDGAMRNRPEYSDVLRYSTGWIHKDVKPDLEFMRLWMLFFDLSEKYAPMVTVRYMNFWFVGKILDANMGFDRQPDPEHPILWAANTPADYPAHDFEPYYMSDEAHNPQRLTVWSGPFYEPAYQKFEVNIATPVYVGDQRVASISISISMDDLEASVLQSEIEGASHAVFRPDGLLIASVDQHPSAEQKKKGIHIAETSNPYLQDLLEIATGINPQNRPHHQSTGYDASGDFYYAVSYLPTPGWYFASMLPGHIVRAQALRSAQWIGWLGLGSSAFLLAVLAAILRRHIVQPLHQLLSAIRAASGGDASGVQATSRVEEMETLGNAFNTMVRQVAERDAALTLEKERFRALIEHAADIISVVDADGILRYVSPSVASTTGFPPAYYLGKSCFNIVHPEDAASVERALTSALQTPGRSIPRLEYRILHRDGRWCTHEATGTNQLDNPSVRGLVINARDITDAKEAEAEIARQRESLYQREKLAAMGSLLAGVAHELNNPLSIVVGRAIMLEESIQDPDTLSSIQSIRASAERCARIVKTFLAMARQHTPQRTQVQLNTVVEASLDMLAYSLRTGGVDIETRLAPDLPPISADADLLHQVVINLIINAQQALAEHPSPRTIRLSTRHDSLLREVQLEVTDNGPGIPEAIRSRIFDPYFTTKPVGIGTGVGLSVSLGIIEAHDGKLLLDTPPNGGAVFTVSLPVQTGEPDSCPRPAADTAGKASKGILRRLLIVDDEKEVAALLSDILQSESVLIDIAHCGREALQELEQGHPYDVIISDLRMPGMDGPELYQAIQRRWPELAKKIIFVTGDTLSPQVLGHLNGSECAVIEKPFIPDEVRRKVEELISATSAPKRSS